MIGCFLKGIDFKSYRNYRIKITLNNPEALIIGKIERYFSIYWFSEHKRKLTEAILHIRYPKREFLHPYYRERASIISLKLLIQRLSHFSVSPHNHFIAFHNWHRLVIAYKHLQEISIKLCEINQIP